MMVSGNTFIVKGKSVTRNEIMDVEWFEMIDAYKNYFYLYCDFS